MKVGIMTCHDVFNYGSSLQAFALSCWLKENGADVQIIDYKPAYLYRLIDFMEVDSPAWQKTCLRRWAYRVRVLPYRLSLLPKYFRYRRFNRKYLPLTKKRYRTLEQLQNGLEYDAYICGSDQVWCSVKNPCGEDPAFYLAFSKAARRIAYAASFGADTISAKGEHCIRAYVPGFDAVGVRESSAVTILQAMGINSRQVVDPVFLLDKDRWRAMASTPECLPEKYVLVYGYDNSINMEQLAQGYADRLGAQVVSLGSGNAYSKLGPREFIGLIEKAKLVVTSSFHAVAFCLILETSFISVQTGNVQLFERISDVLRKYDLEDRIWRQEQPVDPLVPVDFSCYQERIGKDKIESQRFLREALYGAENV